MSSIVQFPNKRLVVEGIGNPLFVGDPQTNSENLLLAMNYLLGLPQGGSTAFAIISGFDYDDITDSYGAGYVYMNGDFYYVAAGLIGGQYLTPNLTNVLSKQFQDANNYPTYVVYYAIPTGTQWGGMPIFNGDMNSYRLNLATLKSYVESLITSEASTRSNADTSESTTRSNAITAEASARSSGDTALSNRINNETLRSTNQFVDHGFSMSTIGDGRGGNYSYVSMIISSSYVGSAIFTWTIGADINTAVFDMTASTAYNLTIKINSSLGKTIKSFSATTTTVQEKFIVQLSTLSSDTWAIIDSPTIV